MRISDWSSDVCSSDLKLNITTVLDAARRPGSRNLCVIASRPQEVWMVMRGIKRALLIHVHPTLHHHLSLADVQLRIAVLESSCKRPANYLVELLKVRLLTPGKSAPQTPAQAYTCR